MLRASLSSSCPSMPGIIKSVTIALTSGRRSNSNASLPLLAQRVFRPSRWKIRDTDSRFARSSSTTRTVTSLIAFRLGRGPAHPRDVLFVDVVHVKLPPHLQHLRDRRIELRGARALLSNCEPFLQGQIEKLFEPFVDRMVSAPREPRALFVCRPEGDERGFFEEGSELQLVPRAGAHQAAIHPDYLERALLEIVGFLGVQREDLVGDIRFGQDQRDHRLCAQQPRRSQSMISIGRPVFAIVSHRDHRIEIAVRAFHRVGQSLHVWLGEIALIRSRLYFVDREAREHYRMTAQRFSIRAQRRAPVRTDLLGQFQALRRNIRRHIRGGQAARGGGRFFPARSRGPFGLLGRRGAGCRGHRQSPATVSSANLIVGAPVEPRNCRSLPTASSCWSICNRSPATVTSCTGYDSSPFSIQRPFAPREY